MFKAKGMKMRKLILSCAFLMWGGLATAGIDDAVAAYQKGDFKAALIEFRELAMKGNAKAQYGLGVLYENGQGVLQDYPKALVVSQGG